ncbi:protein translocase subunit SecF [Corynebacterium halotolerans]|uniref:Protein translocase subunit SecF n=1 Tax=Corynebacterium halotolerans YIM 70093 = DSM 44683 TaxID=1121362 RepID=M1NYN8_9CORY|nr:protein translocase subunit SecF [Corynebacterium halotolerans]AGF72615.1 preprotein translocase subunit SecF [Corynebacterium halotolerans YIM 70093 = DSM 44683]
MSTTATSRKHGVFSRLYTGEGGVDFIGRSRLWYWITAALLVISIGAIGIRGFDLSIDFEGGTKMNMPAGDLVAEEVEETFVEATGVTPELTQIVGAGDSRTLEINSERLGQDQIESARLAIYEEHQPLNAQGEPSPDAIGDSTVSESWGSTITQRMLIAMAVFLVLAFIYIALRLEREMAAAAMLGLAVDGVVIAGIYALIGFEVSPATVIGLLTVLAFSIYDTVIVFDKVRENTAGVLDTRRRTYAEEANLAVNQTIMRSISTSVISALPIIALMVVAVWLMGVGTLRDLALIQFIGVVVGVFSSIFLATPILVTLMTRRKDVRAHTAAVEAHRRGEEITDGTEGDGTEGYDARPKRTVAAPGPARPADPRPDSGTAGTADGPGVGASWRPNRR